MGESAEKKEREEAPAQVTEKAKEEAPLLADDKEKEEVAHASAVEDSKEEPAEEMTRQLAAWAVEESKEEPAEINKGGEVPAQTLESAEKKEEEVPALATESADKKEEEEEEARAP